MKKILLFVMLLVMTTGAFAQDIDMEAVPAKRAAIQEKHKARQEKMEKLREEKKAKTAEQRKMRELRRDKIKARIDKRKKELNLPNNSATTE